MTTPDQQEAPIPTTKVVIVQGKNLSTNDLGIINAARQKEFGSPVAIDPKPDNEEWEKQYFLARNGEKLVAFGRLHEVDVTFENQTYPIFGIATVIALEKGGGYGKTLMIAMKEYIEERGKTGIGFCSKDVTPFYEKCGYGILVDGQQEFHHPAPPKFEGSDVLYIDGEDRLVEKMLAHPGEIAELSKPHW